MHKSGLISTVRAAEPRTMGEKRIGKYAFIASLASGGMAKVYLAVTRGPMEDFKKLVVIKEMHPELATDPNFVGMFMDEARIAARLNHPNVIQTYEVGSEGARHFLAMEYLDGVPYTRVARMKDRVGVPLVLHVRILLDVLAGLHYAHELTDFDGTPLKVVHRDVSPQNILLTYDGHIKLLDFGIAKATSSAPDKKGNELKGKAAYMAPEQVVAGEVDRRADVFCVGIQLWEAVARRRLWDRGSTRSVLQQVLDAEIPDVRTIRADAPKRLAEICARALTRNLDERYATAADMEADLEDFLGQTGQRVTSRDVGNFVSARFGPERAQMRAVIDKQLRRLAAFGPEERATIELAQLAPPVLSEVPPALASEPSTSSSAPSAPPPRESAPAPTLATVIISDSPPPPAEDQSASGVWQRTAREEAAAPTIMMMREPTRKKPPVVLIAGAVVFLCLVSTVGLRLSRPAPRGASPTGQAAPKSTAKVAATGVAPSPAPPAVATGGNGAIGARVASEVATAKEVAPALVELKVKASPPEARLTLDGELLEGNPFVGKRPKDDRPHAVRVEAPGYVAKVETVEFTGNLLLQIELKKSWGGNNAGVAAPAVRPPKTGLDTDDPYAPVPRK